MFVRNKPIVDDERDDRVVGMAVPLENLEEFSHRCVELRTGRVVRDLVFRDLWLPRVHVEEPLRRIVRQMGEKRRVPDEKGLFLTVRDERIDRLHRLTTDREPVISITVRDDVSIRDRLIAVCRARLRLGQRHPGRETGIPPVPLPVLACLQALIANRGKPSGKCRQRSHGIGGPLPSGVEGRLVDLR